MRIHDRHIHSTTIDLPRKHSKNRKNIFHTKFDVIHQIDERHPQMIQTPQLSSSYNNRHFPPPSHHIDIANPFHLLWKCKPATVITPTRSRVYGGILYVPHPNPKLERYALVKGRYSGKWSFPKGHSIEDETPMDCTRREIAEETGIEVLPEPSDYIRIGYGNYYIYSFPIFVSLVPKDQNEIIETRWTTMEEMGFMPLNIDVNRYRKNWLKRHQSIV